MPCRPAICSHSLGRAWVHELTPKLDAASRYGFDIELFYEDLRYIAQDLPGGCTPANLKSAAQHVRKLCDERKIRIICLQPFMQYEGLRDRQRHAERIAEMRVWIDLAQILDTQLIGIPSAFLPESEISGDLDLITSDLQEVADLGLPHGIRFAYEALAWGTHVSTWEASYDIVQRVNRPNFGLLLDTFNILARVYADPAATSGKLPQADRSTAASLQRLVDTVDPAKIAFVQVADGARLEQPLTKGHEFFDPAQHPRMSWSRNRRLFYGEVAAGAYLPVRAALLSIVRDLRFDGYLSAEIFSTDLVADSPRAPFDLAQRAHDSWEAMVADLGLAPDLHDSSSDADGLAEWRAAIPALSSAPASAVQTPMDERPRAQL